MTRRKARKGEVVCNCSSYSFPHRLGGGRCSLTGICRRAVDEGHRECYGCLLWESLDSYSHPGDSPCQVVGGQESPLECPIVQELLAFNKTSTPRRSKCKP